MGGYNVAGGGNVLTGKGPFQVVSNRTGGVSVPHFGLGGIFCFGYTYCCYFCSQ